MQFANITRWRINAYSRTLTPNARVRIARSARYQRRYHARYLVKDAISTAIRRALLRYSQTGQDT